jgi:mono/diheme cytochrome c family protein
MYKILSSSVIIVVVFIFTASFFQKFDLPKSIERGKEVYVANCVSCHMMDGNGMTDVYPPLNKSDYLRKPVKILINVVLQGQNGEVVVNGKKYNVEMPAQNYLTDEQISDALNYIRNSWNNKIHVAVTPSQVKVLRK